MATLTVTAAHNYTGENLGPDPIDQILYTAAVAATFSDSQFGTGNGLIANNVLITGSAGVNTISVTVNGTTFSAAAWQFAANWGAADHVLINAGGSNDTITGSSHIDQIIAAGGADHVNAGAGDDTIGVGSGSIAAGETIDGGADNDTLQITSGAEDLTLAGTSITNVEILRFSNNNVSVTASGSNFGGAGDFTSLIGGNTADTQALIVNGNSVDLSSVTITNWGGANQTITINGTNATLNLLSGSSEKDIITGTGSSVDGMRGFGGADTLNGGLGDDTFFYNAAGEVEAGEVISGGGGTDTISLSNAGSNDFSGAAITAVETLDFQSGNSTVTFTGTQLGGAVSSFAVVSGGSGTDALVVNAAPSVDLSGLTFNTWTVGTDTITINGTANGQTLTGSSQDDIITGGLGADTINGGNGNDTFSYVAGAEAASGESVNGGGGTGDKILLVDTGDIDFNSVTITSVERLEYSGAGTSSASFTVSQAGLFGTVTGSGGVNAFTVLSATNTNLSGTTFNSWTAGTDTITINGSSVGDTLTGSNQNDIIFGGLGADTMNGGDLDDIFRYLAAGEVGGNEVINGGNGADTIQLTNAESNNFALTAAITGVEALDFESGNSTAFFLGTHFGGGKIASVSGSVGTDTLIVIANPNVDLSGVSFTSWTNGVDVITINGTGGTETLIGSSQNDTINGLNGADSLYGVAGADVLNGGNDGDYLNGGDGGDTLYGDAGNDTLEGRADADYLGGGAGTDSMYAGIGNDVLQGGDDADYLDGSAGGDTMYGDGGDDIMDGGADLSSDADYLDGGDGNDTLYARGGNDTVVGGTGFDALYGDAGNDYLFGGEGNDYLGGQDGGDFMQAGIGDDSMDGGAVADYMEGEAGANSMYGGDGGDVMHGGADADYLGGQNGSDTLYGEGGNDVLDGGSDSSDDYLDGGALGDAYIFGTGMGHDVIGTFDDGGGAGFEDYIYIDHNIVANFATLSPAMAQNGANVIVNLGGFGAIQINSVTLGTLGADDFIFY